MDNIYPEIVKWSSGKPTWLQDALRRFVLKGSLEQEDLEQLTAICKSARGINVGRAVPRPVPLTAQHVPDNTALGGSVALSQLRNFRGVNRISTDAVLNLKPTGLNVIYGDNGAGKSGYIRVLKKLCRARGSDEEIYQNVFSDEEEEQGAQVSFTEGDTAKGFDWDSETPPPPELSAISVFDSQCALVHVDGRNELAYQPFGLDLMTRVAAVATKLNASFRAELAASQRDRDDFADFALNTSTRTKLQRLNKDLSDEAIRESFGFSRTEQKELTTSLKQLADFKANDPGKKIIELTAQVRRLTELNAHLDTLIAKYSKRALTEIVELREKLRNAKESVQLSRNEFKDAPVRGTGGEAWRTLWEAARHYFEHEAYPAKRFPVERCVKCVLCQQEIVGEAKDRLLSFEAL